MQIGMQHIPIITMIVGGIIVIIAIIYKILQNQKEKKK